MKLRKYENRAKSTTFGRSKLFKEFEIDSFFHIGLSSKSIGKSDLHFEDISDDENDEEIFKGTHLFLFYK